MTRAIDSWHSERLERSVDVARWGDFGVPVLMFPTAGGDALEIERFHMIDACSELVDAGRIKIYSCDSVNGLAMLTQEGDSQHLSWMLRQFVEFVGQELVPAIRADCESDDIEIIATGSSIGAFNALSALCRYPDAFQHAICMSGTYDLRRFLGGAPSQHFEWASPLHNLGSFDEDHMTKLRSRSVILASGEGANEDLGESWHAAHVLGEAGVPNRVDPWGPQWPHDWPLWREMLPHYLDQLL